MGAFTSTPSAVPPPSGGGSTPPTTPPSVADPTEMWIGVSPTSSSSATGSGTEASPMLVSNADQFDLLLDRTGIKTFRLLPGEFRTKGTWAHPPYWCTLPLGGSIIGSGMDRTTIKLDPAALFPADLGHAQDTNVLWMGAWNTNNGPSHISDLTIDGNQAAFPDDRYPSGLKLWGNGCSVRNVRVRGIRGKQGTAFEVFGIALNNAATGPWAGDDGGSLIQDCIVEDVASPSAFVTGIYCGYDDHTRRILPSVVERCTCKLGSINQAAFSSNCETTFRQCAGIGAIFGFYNDSGTVDHMVITDSTISGGRVGVSIKTAGSSPGLRKRSLKINGCRFSVSLIGGLSPIGVEIWDDKPGNGRPPLPNVPYTDMDIASNVFEASGGALYMGSVLFYVGNTIRFRDNIVPAGTKQNIVYFIEPGHIPAVPTGAVTITNNWYADGTPIPGDLPT